MLVYRALVPLQKTQKVWKSTLTAKSSFVLAYRALVPLYKTQNQIHPAPQAKILRICISKCKILPAPQAIFLPIYTSQMQNPIGNRHIRGAKTPKFSRSPPMGGGSKPQNSLDFPPYRGGNFQNFPPRPSRLGGGK